MSNTKSTKRGKLINTAATAFVNDHTSTDDLLPQVGGMRLLETRQNTDDVIDL